MLAAEVSPIRERHPRVPVEERVVLAGPGSALVEASRDAGLVVLGRRRSPHHLGPRLGHAAIVLLHHSQAPPLVLPPD